VIFWEKKSFFNFILFFKQEANFLEKISNNKASQEDDATDGTYVPPRPRPQRPQKTNKRKTPVEEEYDSEQSVHDDDDEFIIPKV
jgi:hypothetical protein